MKLGSTLPVTVLFMLLTVGDATACSQGETHFQRVELLSADRSLDRWVVDPAHIHQTRLSNGFQLGVGIRPLSADEDATHGKRWREHQPTASELLAILIYDMGTTEPTLLSRTYGPPNSLQGFSASGAANRVVQLGEPGVVLRLHREACGATSAGKR